MLAALGPHRFALSGVALGRLSRVAAPRGERQAVIGGLPVLHVTGRKPDALTLSAVLYPIAMPGEGLGTLEGLARDARAATPLPFATADGLFRGLFVITGLTDRREMLDAEGRPQKVSVEIELEEDEPAAPGGRLPGLFG